MTNARGIDIFCLTRKYLVYNLVSRNLKIKYRYSIFGFLWTLIVPLSQALVFYTVFNLILKVQVPNYLVLILSGILPWAFFSQTIFEGMDSIVANSSIITKVPVPLQVFPYTGALTNLTTLVLSTPVVLGTMIWSEMPIKLSLLWLPFFWGNLFIIAFGFSVTLGLLFIYFRDIKHILGILIQLWFYGTPVLYNEAMIPPELRWLLALNPVGELFVGIHQVCYQGQSPSSEQILFPLVWSMGAFVAAIFSLKFLTRRAVESL